MSDLKSKLPDLKELSSMACKLFNGIKSSVGEIIQDYKQKRSVDETKQESANPVKKGRSKPETGSDKKDS